MTTITALYLFIAVFGGHGTSQVEIGPFTYEECTKAMSNAADRGHAWLTILDRAQEHLPVIDARCEPWPYTADEHWD
jgi:hypothetical protein